MSRKWKVKSAYQVTLNLTTGDQCILPPDPRRCSLWIDSSTNTINIAFGKATTGNDFTIVGSSNPVLLTRDDIGDLITQEVHVRAAAGYTTVWIVGQDED